MPQNATTTAECFSDCPNGQAVEPVLIRKKFLKWQDAHPEFPRIVFHGLRHSSATYQLMISGGDVKAVQGTTGHASADMLVNTYAHIQQDFPQRAGTKVRGELLQGSR